MAHLRLTILKSPRSKLDFFRRRHITSVSRLEGPSPLLRRRWLFPRPVKPPPPADIRNQRWQGLQKQAADLSLLRLLPTSSNWIVSHTAGQADTLELTNHHYPQSTGKSGYSWPPNSHLTAIAQILIGHGQPRRLPQAYNGLDPAHFFHSVLPNSLSC